MHSTHEVAVPNILTYSATYTLTCDGHEDSSKIRREAWAWIDAHYNECDRIIDLRTGIAEAIQNAVRHGSKPGQTVTVKLLGDRYVIIAHIIDEGSGYNFDRCVSNDAHKGLRLIQAAGSTKVMCRYGYCDVRIGAIIPKEARR